MGASCGQAGEGMLIVLPEANASLGIARAARAARASAFLAIRLSACALLLFLLAACLHPAQAWAYFDRGEVEVSLGTSSLELDAGESSSVTVAFTPSSDEQTEGCGMPSCPQGCSESCLDENGQCQCAGSYYSTYYPDAVALSSDSSVAVAVYDAGTLTVYGVAEGEATITLRASLRQFTDGEATVSVTVSGINEETDSGGSAEVELPEEAEIEADQEDKADVVDKEIMGRAIRYVRINEACDVEDNLYDFAELDGDLTFWSGDTYYHPDYSLTVTGSDFAAADVFSFNPDLEFSTEATGTLSQILGGLDAYLLVDFEEEDAFPTPVTVYVSAEGAFSDGDEVVLYSFDEQTKNFVREDAEATVEGGYAIFTVQEGKLYALSTQDLSSEATEVVELGNSSTNENGVSSDAGAAGLPPIAFALAAIIVLAAAIVVAVGVAMGKSGRGRKHEEGAADEAVHPQK